MPAIEHKPWQLGSAQLPTNMTALYDKATPTGKL